MDEGMRDAGDRSSGELFSTRICLKLGGGLMMGGECTSWWFHLLLESLDLMRRLELCRRGTDKV